MAQVAARQLPSLLSKALGRLYVLVGEEPLQQLESADAIRAAARTAGFTERTVFTVTGARFDWSEVLAATSAQSLFADRQIIEIRIPSAKPGREGGVALQQLAQQTDANGDTLVLVSLGDRMDRSAKNTAWFKALEQHGAVVACDPVDRAALPQWITQRLAAKGLQLQPAEEGKRALSFFADHVEGNLLAAHQEIEKLSLLYPATGQTSRILSFEEVESAVMDVARYDLFQLTQVILSGQAERSMRMLDGLLHEGQPAVRIHWALSDEIATLWRVRQSLQQGQPMPLALRENRVWGVRERLYERSVGRMTIQSCQQLLVSAHICDGLVKGLPYPGWPSSVMEALRRLVLEMLDALSVREKAGDGMTGKLALHG